MNKYIFWILEVFLFRCFLNSVRGLFLVGLLLYLVYGFIMYFFVILMFVFCWNKIKKMYREFLILVRVKGNNDRFELD